MKKQCIICLHGIKTRKSLTMIKEDYETGCECNYYYHNRCIKTWWNRKEYKTCPICRRGVFSCFSNKKVSEYYVKLTVIILFCLKYLKFIQYFLTTFFFLVFFDIYIYFMTLIIFFMIKVILKNNILLGLTLGLMILTITYLSQKEETISLI